MVGIYCHDTGLLRTHIHHHAHDSPEKDGSQGIGGGQEHATFETGNVRQMSDIEALNKYFTNQYIVAHDSYNYYAIRNDYSTVQIYSTQEVFDDYKKKFEPPVSIEKQLSKDKNLEISVVTIEQEDIPTPFKGEEDTGVTMRARIDKTIRNGDQILSRQSGIVTLTFGYDADLDMDEKARNMNPLGFVVTSYKFTPDMATDAVASGEQQ